MFSLLGHMLDTFARSALWEVGLNYNHGTGHGVGSYLNVHEGKLLFELTRCLFHRVAPCGQKAVSSFFFSNV